MLSSFGFQLNTSLPGFLNSVTTVIGNKFNQLIHILMLLFPTSCQFLRPAGRRTASFVPVSVYFLIGPHFAPVNLVHEGLTEAEAEIQLKFIHPSASGKPSPKKFNEG
jgi:hypothetical protein